ncbi:MAG: hypothetical protein PHX74_10145 [Candidatus Sumerlaeales bacterium]|nr:hypothetical protein [Candidatus Sumerlaeales bacterium]
MNREEAIEVLIDRYNSGVIRSRTNDDEWRLATETVIDALLEPTHEWVRTTDRLPTEEDAIEVHDEWGFTHQEVAVLSSGWPFEALVKDIPAMLPGIMDIETIENKTTTFPYWMPLPKPPEVEE